jgi:DNA-binding PadR family transcriptional regulator
MRDKSRCILDRVALMELLMYIHKGKNYATKIAIEKGVHPSPILKQLYELEKLGLVKSKREKLLNKVVFRLTPLGITTHLFHCRIEKEKRFYLRRIKEIYNEGVKDDGGF